MDLRVTGANELQAVSATIRRLGDTQIRRELLRMIQQAAKPLKEAAKTSAHDHLPHGGGLNEVVAGSKFAIRTRTSGRNPGVRVVAASGHNIARMDRGSVRHPVYPRGPRSGWTWTEQKIPAGWFTKALEDKAPEVRAEIVHGLDDLARRVS